MENPEFIATPVEAATEPVPVNPVQLKKKSSLLEVFVVIFLFLLAVGLGAYYLLNQKPDNKGTDNQVVDITVTATPVTKVDGVDLETLASYDQSDNTETQLFYDTSLGIEINIPKFMSFSGSDQVYKFNYFGPYSMPQTEGDQDSLSILIFRDLQLVTQEGTSQMQFNELWNHTQELKTIGSRQLQAFEYIGPSELTCKLYIFNANDGKVGGFCFNESRRFVAHTDGGITGDSAQIAAADLAKYNEIVNTVINSIKFTTTYQSFSDTDSGISMQIPTKFGFKPYQDNLNNGFVGNVLGKYAGPYTGGEGDTMSLYLFPKFNPDNPTIPGQYTYTGEKLVIDGREIKVYATQSIQLEANDCVTWGFTGNDSNSWGLTFCEARHLYDNYFTGWDFRALVDSEKLEYSKIMADIKSSVKFE